jgi:uncharacterized protein (TIGR03435 family)
VSRVKQMVSAVSAILLLSIALGGAQTSRPTFEVASIKPSTRRGSINTPPGGRFIAVGQSLRILIGYAYRLRDFQVIGGPAWMDNDLWEIQAKAEESTVVPQPPTRTIADAMKIDTIALMLQSLLEDRFSLRLHSERRDLPIYELIKGKGGPKIRLAEDQTPPTPSAAPPPRLPNALPVLTRGSFSISRNPSGMHLEAKAIPLDRLVNMLINVTNRTVIDKTGLAGLYDIKLEWAPDTLQSPVSPTADSPPVVSAPTGPALTTAIEEQLGLRLVSAKAPLEVLVIDHVERPSEN